VSTAGTPPRKPPADSSAGKPSPAAETDKATASKATAERAATDKATASGAPAAGGGSGKAAGAPAAAAGAETAQQQRSSSATPPQTGLRPSAQATGVTAAASAAAAQGDIRPGLARPLPPEGRPDQRRETAAEPVAPVRPAGPRRARLMVTRIDPWSVMKTAFMLSVSVAIVMLVAVALLWWTLSTTGVFESIGRIVNDLASSGSTTFDFANLVGFDRVIGVALIISAVEIVLSSALSTLFAFLYNLSVGLTGGVELTLSEDA